GFRSLGIGGMAVTLLSVLIAMTFLPAVMAVLGGRVNALALFRTRGRGSRAWRRLAEWGRRRPVLIAIPVGLFLLFLGLPLLNIKVGISGVDLLPPELESRQGWELASQQFGEGNLSPILIVARPEDGTFHPQSIARLHDYVASLGADNRIRRVESIVSLDPAITREQYQQLYSLPPEQIPFPQVRAAVKAMATERVTIIRAYSHLDPEGDEAKALVRDLRASKPPGLGIDVDGVTAALMDDVDTIYGSFPWVILLVMATTYLALLILFRSVWLPLKAIVMNMLSLTASYGALVFIFQEGHFRRFLGFETPGYTQAITPVIMFCIIFGLSMDYEVFLLSRIKEAYDETGDNSEGVAVGLEKTGAIITSAAVVLALVAASFATGYLVVVKALGVGIGLAVLIDALVVRTLLVPALMYIMGRWNWWAPGFVVRWLPGGSQRR
ncbi:MAG: MMPL family transporter, partial [Chloroflexota bacterium]